MSCNKCKQAPPQPGDSWCLACSGWEALGVELGGKWGNPALRALAEEVVVGAVRQVRGLRRVACLIAASAGSGRAEERSDLPSLTTAAKSSARPPLPRNPPPAPKEEREESDEQEEEEEEESEEAAQDRRDEDRGGSDRRDRRGDERAVTPARGPAPRPPERERSRRRERDREGRRRQSTRRHRGGRKHKRLARGLDNPSVPLHRSTPGSYWDLPTNRRGLGALPSHH